MENRGGAPLLLKRSEILLDFQCCGYSFNPRMSCFNLWRLPTTWREYFDVHVSYFVHFPKCGFEIRSALLSFFAIIVGCFICSPFVISLRIGYVLLCFRPLSRSSSQLWREEERNGQMKHARDLRWYDDSCTVTYNQNRRATVEPRVSKVIRTSFFLPTYVHVDKTRKWNNDIQTINTLN